MDNYSSEDIEEYLLLAYKPKKGRTIPKNLLLNGLELSFFAVMILAGTVVITMNSFNVNILVLAAIIALLFAVAVAMGATLNHIGLRNNVRKSQQCANASIRTSTVSPFIGAFSALGGVVGLGFARFFFPRLSDIGVGIIVCVFAWPLFLLLLIAGSSQCHQVYWIYKHCPQLKDRRR